MGRRGLWEGSYEGGVGLKEQGLAGCGGGGGGVCSLETFAKGGGEQVVILILLGLSFCPLSGLALFDPSNALFPQCWLLCFAGENVVFVLQRLFIHGLPWWGPAREGLCMRSRFLAAGGQGPPLSPFSALCGLHRALRVPSLGIQIMLCWGWRGSSGQTVSASLFLKIAFVNIFSLILIQNRCSKAW